MCKRLLGVTLLLVLASNLCWAQYRFRGTFYPLRWGQTEGSQDLITPVNALWNPLCVKMGTSWSAYLDGARNVLGWKVSDARLRSVVDGTVYFTVIDAGVGNLRSPGQAYPLPDLPAQVDHALLEISYVIYYWGSWGPTSYLTPIYSSEVFIVLDAPKAPMSPAWVSVLRISCRWARGESTEERAARKLTERLHKEGNYNGGQLAYTRLPPDSDTGEDFYLRAFLKDDLGEGPYWGQCNDFADFLVCLMTSVGIQRSAQRTHSLVNSRRVTTLPNGNSGPLLGFHTHPLDAAPTGDRGYNKEAEWSYHQFCLDWGSMQVWDGSIAFLPQNWQPGDPVTGQVFVLGMPREPDYRDRLVKYYIFLDLVTGQEVMIYDPSFFWQPTPSPSGLIPNVYASALPP
jgi:hypothetical protein